MSRLPVILIALPGLPAIFNLLKTVALFAKDFCEAFVMEFKATYYTEAIHGRDINNSN